VAGAALAFYQCDVAPLYEGEKVTGAFAVGLDVTERKIAEDRLGHRASLMIEAEAIAHLGTWEWDVSQPVVAWSDELYRIYDVSPETFRPSYESYLDKVHPQDRERVRAVMTRVFSEHISFSHDERIVRPDGSIRHLHTWGHPVVDGSGQLVRLLGICQDITERKLAEEAVQQSLTDLHRTATENATLYTEAQKAIELRDDFLSIAAHELRTPLTPLSILLQLLRNHFADALLPDASSQVAKRPVGGSLVKLIESSNRQVARLSRLIDDLLDVSRISSGRLTLNLEDVDLSTLVLEAVERVRSELVKANCTVELEVQPGTLGRWDRLRIEQIVFNLLTNAAKYGAGKPVKITVSGDAHKAVLMVQDFGIGISKDAQERIFNRFERAVSLRRFGGLGLGLYIARQIAEGHGGTISVESEPGLGATFTVQLPPLAPPPVQEAGRTTTENVRQSS
jgi:signal transduction histidine kinase